MGGRGQEPNNTEPDMKGFLLLTVAVVVIVLLNLAWLSAIGSPNPLDFET